MGIGVLGRCARGFGIGRWPSRRQVMLRCEAPKKRVTHRHWRSFALSRTAIFAELVEATHGTFWESHLQVVPVAPSESELGKAITCDVETAENPDFA